MPVNAVAHVAYGDVEHALKHLNKKLQKEHAMEKVLASRYALSKGQRARKKRLKARARILAGQLRAEKAYEASGRAEL